ncbi:MAG: hypothetical protein ABI229_06215 [Gemmatimonadaceae bacterium]
MRSFKETRADAARYGSVLAGFTLIGVVLTTPSQGGWAWAYTAGPFLGIFGGAIVHFARGWRFTSSALMKSAAVGSLLAPIVVWIEGAGSYDVFGVLGGSLFYAVTFGGSASLILFGFREPTSRIGQHVATQPSAQPSRAKAAIRAWTGSRLACVLLSFPVAEWLLYRFILNGNAPLTARQLLGVLLLIVIPAAAIVIGWTWFSAGAHRARSRAQPGIRVRIRLMTPGQFWLMTAILALTCFPFIHRSQTGYDRLVSQQQDADTMLNANELLLQRTAYLVTPAERDAEFKQELVLRSHLGAEFKQELDRERTVGYECDAGVILIGAMWVLIAWGWFGRSSMTRARA